MIDLNERCPICGGIIGYHINSYGRIVEQCSKCKHIIPDDPVITTNKTTITNNNYVANTNVLPHNYSKDYIKIDDCKPYEIDQCRCGGNPAKCDFYPEVREKAYRQTQEYRDKKELEFYRTWIEEHQLKNLVERAFEEWFNENC